MDIKEKEMKLREELLIDNKNLFVIAGAGAGKTYSLVHRIIESLENGVKTSEVVAITFTNKSAEKLRESIIEELDKIKSPHLNTIDLMTISTIHKFCIDILRENSIYASLSPDFKLLEDDFTRINYISNKYFRGFEDWHKFDIYNKTKYEISEKIKNYYYTLVEYVDKIPFDNIYKESYDPNNCYNEMLNYITEIKNIVDNNKYDLLNIAKEGTTLEGLFNKDYIIFNDESITPKNLLESVSFTAKSNIFNSKLYLKGAKEQYNNIKALIDEAKDKFLLAKKKLNVCYNNLALKYAYEIYELYLDYISNDHINITNNQAIYLAMKLLDNKEICNKLHNKYKHIYIDEYQDTDHMQYNIASKLTKLNGLFPNDSALFLVGDPKQSIYRFRGAEPELYKTTMDEFDADKNNCKIYKLDINFRSNSKILDYVNNVYSKPTLLLTDPNKNEYSCMLPANKNIINLGEICSENLTGFYKFEAGESKEDSLVKLIKYLKKNKHVRKNGKYENISFKDIMIILKDHKVMPKYVKILNDNNIPTMVSGESKFYLLFPIRCFVLLFESLNTRGPKSRQMAYEVLKNVFNDKFVGLGCEDENKLLNSYYNKLKQETAHKSAYGIAIYLIKHLNWIVKENSIEWDYMLNSISSKLYQMVETVFAGDYLNGNELSKEFRKYLDPDLYVEYESLTDEDADAVKIINVHKSKGLEAPVCIWLFDDKSKDNNKWYKDNILYLRDLFLNEILLSNLELDDKLEINRLEYVAATRAQEAFIFFKTKSNTGMFSSDEYEIDKLDSIEIDNDFEDDNKKDLDDYKIKNNNYLIDDSSLKIISPSSLENNKSETREKYKNNNFNSDRPVGNILGTVLHRALELLVLNNDIEKSINKALAENIDDINDYDSFYRFIKVCLIETNKYYKNNNYYNYKLYPELTFSYLKEDNLISNGSIDLLLINNNEIKIIDYKSDCAEYIEDDSIFELTLKEKYSPQLDLYEKTVKDIFKDIKNLKIIKSIIYFRNYNKEKETVKVKEYIL